MNTPKIRFKGFTDDWEQRKLGEIVLRESLARESTIDLPYVEYEDVIAEEGRINKDIRKKEGIKKGIFFDGSQVLYGKLRPYLHNWLNPDFSGVAVGDWWVLKPNNVDKNFIYRLIQTQQFDDIANQSTGSKMPRADWNLVSNTEFAIPTSQVEQTKIGGYFFTLDNLITLHQRKCDETKQLKKFMLQKMFPKNGEKNPEIRFKGFTDDWEQRKLGELCNITTGKLDANAMVSDGQYDFYTSGIDVFKIDVAAFEGPAITIAGNGASVGYMHLADGKFNAYQRTYVLTDFLADRQFLNVAIGNELPNKIQEEVRGSGIPYIVLNMLTDLAIPFPSHEEQYAIGVYFQQLDHLITLHQRKCEKLKELKKFMLQNMFV